MSRPLSERPSIQHQDCALDGMEVGVAEAIIFRFRFWTAEGEVCDMTRTATILIKGQTMLTTDSDHLTTGIDDLDLIFLEG